MVCSTWSSDRLCDQCRSRLVQVPPLVSGELSIASAFRHETVARRLVHLLKYDAIGGAADVLALSMVERLYPRARAVIPVPRAWLRRARHGVDPAMELARRLSNLSGIPVVAALRPHLWWPAHAGSDRASRRPPGFRQVAPVPDNAVLVDDVATTGITLSTAGDLLGVTMAVTATRAVGSGFDRMS
jgi:predicted amidophosphoribosyltransferase